MPSAVVNSPRLLRVTCARYADSSMEF